MLLLFSTACKDEGDLVFMVDESGSIDSRNFELIKQFLSDLITGLPVANNNIRVAITKFSDYNTPIFYLNQ